MLCISSSRPCPLTRRQAETQHPDWWPKPVWQGGFTALSFVYSAFADTGGHCHRKILCFSRASEGQTRTKPVFMFPVFLQVIRPRLQPQQAPGHAASGWTQRVSSWPTQARVVCPSLSAGRPAPVQAVPCKQEAGGWTAISLLPCGPVPKGRWPNKQGAEAFLVRCNCTLTYLSQLPVRRDGLLLNVFSCFFGLPVGQAVSGVLLSVAWLSELSPS